MRVYHGSYTKIDRIDLSKSVPNKDFGRGFYVTKIRRHAETWAETVGEINGTKGFVTEFDYTESDFAERICKIKRFDRYDEEWLDFVVMNRNKKNSDPMHDYDIVEGPVANDKVQITLRLYLKGKIAKNKFLDMLTFHEETHQICFCTVNALQLLDCAENEADSDIDCELYQTGEKIMAQLVIDFGFDAVKAADLFFSSAVFSKLSEKSTGFYLKTPQKIYEMIKKELNL